MDQLIRAKRLLQTYDVVETGRSRDKVERHHPRYRDHRQIRHAFAHDADDIETVDPEHDGDHPALIRLVVDDKNAGHGRLPDRVQKPTTEPRIWTRTLEQPVGVFPEVSKDGVTRLGEPAAPRPVTQRVSLG